MKKPFIIALFMFAATSVNAQETRDTFRVREVVVSATRLPLERSSIAASVSVITSQELELKGIRNVGEALRLVSGAAVVQSGSYGAPTSLFMRGGESEYVQVLIDGVQVNSPGEIFDFANLSVEGIERIEVVRGPVSVLYGSDAVAGVVQLFTKQGGAKTRVDGAVAAGSHESAALHGTLTGAGKGVSYGVGISHFRTSGTYAFNNEHDNTGITGRVAVGTGSSTDFSATLRYNTNTFHYPTGSSGALEDRNQFHAGSTIAAGLEGGHRFSSRLEARAELGFNRNDDTYNDAPDGPADTIGFTSFFSDQRFQREAADLRFNYTLGNSILTVGGDYQNQRERGWNVFETSPPTRVRSGRAGYAQLVTAAAGVHVQAGGRYDDDEEFGGFGTWRAGVSAPISRWLRLRASAGTAFKQPRFYEQFATGFVTGNPDLTPETSRSIESGIEAGRGHTRVQATYFTQRFRNLIQYVGAPPQGQPNYLNLAGADANGVELEATHALGHLSLRGAFTRFDTKVTDAGTGDDPLFAAGEKLIRRPDQVASLSATYTSRYATVSGTAHYVGERNDLNFAGFPATRVVMPSYTRVDVAGEVAVGRSGLKATLKLQNALNAHYEEIYNFPAPRRAVMIGVKYGR